MGWLGWTERESLDTDVNSIMIAMEGKLEMMYPQAKEKAQKKKSAPERFKAFAAANNAKQEQKTNGRR